MSNRAPAGAPAITPTFDDVVVPHLDAAHRLARWLVGNEHDAEDVVQEASLRAFRYFRTFTGGNGRAWFLRIVRNTSSRWRSHNLHVTDPFDEEAHTVDLPASNPETILLRVDDGTRLARAIGHLSTRYRELLVQRELNGLTYRELAEATGRPIGSVMSGLSRARHALREALHNEMKRSEAYEEPDGRSDCDSRSARLDSQ
jgi:RNA polymerase sigma-70 factor, ECF subfamily